MIEEERSISYLNQKICYRLLKVLYVFGYVGSVLLGVAVAYFGQMSERKIVDNNKTVITCQSGNKGQYIAAENSIYFDASNFEADYLPDHFLSRLQELCGIPKEEIQEGLSRILSNNSGSGSSERTKLFEVKPTYIVEGGIPSLLWYSALWAFGVTAVFEITRRALYYVAIGKVFPKQ